MSDGDYLRHWVDNQFHRSAYPVKQRIELIAARLDSFDAAGFTGKVLLERSSSWQHISYPMTLEPGDYVTEIDTDKGTIEVKPFIVSR